MGRGHCMFFTLLSSLFPLYFYCFLLVFICSIHISFEPDGGNYEVAIRRKKIEICKAQKVPKAKTEKINMDRAEMKNLSDKNTKEIVNERNRALTELESEKNKS